LAAFPPGEAREDWTILRALSERLGSVLPYDSLGDLRARLVQVNPVFAAIDTVEPAAWDATATSGDAAIEARAFDLPVRNFYMTCPISRASKTMAACTEAFVVAPAQAAAE
jgi:NADH-quinone oxidoreductase subunit G